MADKSIIFSAPMVRALIEGSKTQTRRVLKIGNDREPPYVAKYETGARAVWIDEEDQVWCFRGPAVGDRLWVKEAIRPQLLRNILTGEELPNVWAAAYDADGEDVVDEHGFNLLPWWKKGGKLSPIFMPRWASRLTPTVTDVRVQRVQDISEEDAVAEGIEPYAGIDPDCGGYRDYSSPSGDYWLHPRGSFGTLWNRLHAKPKPVKGPDGKVRHYVSYPWEDVQEARTFQGLPWIVTGNPWVAAYTFTVRRGNIDGGKAKQAEGRG